MTKTLALILHYNTPDMTNTLYESLSPYMGDDYDLFVLDNGSDGDKKSTHPSLKTGYNGYFGGGLNWAFNYVIEHEEYDSLLFLNSDLILDGNDFVKTLRLGMFENDFKIVSPSILVEGGSPGCKWKQMSNWKSSMTREVKWIDFQCPMFSRDFILHLGQFDERLKYGWGQDVYSGYVCEKVGWKVGVCDLVGVDHLDSVTEKLEGKRKLAKLQKTNMRYFFNDNELDLDFLRNWAKNYEFK